jgi:hypothetical protein
MQVLDILRHYRDGDEYGWDTEFDMLRSEHGERLYEIARTAHRDGIREPILLGNDGRVWDGHHRLCVAVDFGIVRVPVDRAGGNDAA